MGPQFIRKSNVNIFYNHKGGDEITGDEPDETQAFDLSQCSPERLISVAERSVLSQHFVNGTEESVESIVGVEKKVIEKPLSYGEFKAAVRRTAENSNAPSHEEFMWEVSQPWKALRATNFKSIGLTSFKKAVDEN